MTWRLLLSTLILASQASAAVIRGSVRSLSVAGDPPARYVTRGAVKSEDASTHGMSGSVAVVVEPTDRTPPPPLQPSDTQFVMAQEGTAFVPNLLVVPVGGVVSFPNHDPLFHNVFSYSPAKSFDLGRYPRGQTRTVTFDKPGIVRVFCEIHASMYAAILVAGSPWYQKVSPGEIFEFSDLPPGRYKVLAVDATGRFTDYDVTLTKTEIHEVHLNLGH